MLHRSSLLLGALAFLSSAAICQAAKGLDPAARQIVRTVASESLKPISTKDAVIVHDHATDVEDHVHAVEIEGVPANGVAHLEEPGPVVLPAKIQSGPAPGVSEPATRKPAAKEEKPASHAEEPGIPADKSLNWLENGNKRFIKNANRTDGKSQIDRARVSKSQKPHAIILSCSDSRVPPETVFDQALGEVFVVRTAGEALDSSVIASIEYAVEHLGSRLLVVMGHTSCGAVKATITTNEGSSAGSPSLDALIADIRPRLPSRGPAGVPSHGLEIESSANAQGVAADLVKRSAIIRSRVEKGDLTIKPALYHLDSGFVKFY